MATVFAMSTGYKKNRLLRAAGWALLLEAALLSATLVLSARRETTPSPPPPTLLSLATLPEIKPIAQPAPKPTPTEPKPLTPPVPRPRPLVHVQPPAAPTPIQPISPPLAAAPLATPNEPAPPPRPAPAAPAQAGPTPSFDNALRAAIEGALRYPESARMAGMKGRARVAFKYRDGAVSDVSIVISSGIGILDRAAIAAVQDAVCPKPEPAFVGKTLSEQVWVDFKLDDTE